MIYLVIFWAVQAAAVGLMVVAVRRASVGRRAFLLFLSPLPVALCIFWGKRFGVEPGSSGAADGSFIADAPAWFALASIFIWLGLIGVLRHARLIAAIVGLLETATTLMVALLATMQVTGSWI
jgi:hypothetical protein